MRTFGIFVAFCGVMAALIALNMTVTVSGYGGTSINNIGLMNDRQNYLLMSGVAIIAGVIMAVVGNRSMDVPRGLADPFDELDAMQQSRRKRYAIELGITRRGEHYFYDERPHLDLEAAIRNAEQAQGVQPVDHEAIDRQQKADEEKARRDDRVVYIGVGVGLVVLIIIFVFTSTLHS